MDGVKEEGFIIKSEKVTINLGAVELAQIDFLVEKGLYASRSDFIRLAIRKQTEEHQKEIKQFVDPSAQGTFASVGLFTGPFVWGLGLSGIGQEHVEEAFRAGRKISIRVIGILKIDEDVNPEQFRQVLKHVKIFGKVKAEPEIKKIIEEFNQKHSGKINELKL